MSVKSDLSNKESVKSGSSSSTNVTTSTSKKGTLFLDKDNITMPRGLTPRKGSHETVVPLSAIKSSLSIRPKSSSMKGSAYGDPVPTRRNLTSDSELLSVASPDSRQPQTDAATSCKIILDLSEISNHSSTLLSYILPGEKCYSLLISDRHQYIFTDCAFISIKGINPNSTTSRYPVPTTSRPSSGGQSTAANSSGMKKQQIKRFDYADHIISHVALTTPSLSAPVSDGLLEFRMNRPSANCSSGGSLAATTAASTSAGSKPIDAASEEKKSYDLISIDIKRSDWGGKVKLLYRTLVSLQRCQKRFDSAFELEKNILTKSITISFPAQPTGTDINYYPEYTDMVVVQQRQQDQRSMALYGVVTSLTETSLNRYKPMSYKAIWEENISMSVNVDDSTAEDGSNNT